jgi:cytochrome c oxidase subunit III
MTAAPRTIDASKLPDHAWDAHAALWWGNLLLIFIETTSMVLLFASYFYIRRNLWEWTPPRTDTIPPMLNPVPQLGAATVNVLLLLGSCVPMYWTDMAARKQDRGRVSIGLAILIAVGLICCLLRWREFDDVHFKWNDNAYASCVWTILLMHLIYILTGVVEFILIFVWSLLHPVEEKHGLDVTLMGGFWYWVAGIGLVSYVIVYWYPRWT